MVSASRAQALASLNLAPASVTGGQASVGIVRLTKAVAVDTALTVASNIASVTTSQTVIVPAGSATGTFPISTQPVTATTKALIMVTLGTHYKKAYLAIAKPDTLTGISVWTSTYDGSTSGNVEVGLAAPAPSGGFVVNLSASSPCAQLPASLTVPPGSNAWLVGFQISGVASPTALVITATANGVSKKTTVTIQPTFQLTLSRTNVLGGTTVVGNIILSGPAPVGGVTFSLYSMNSNETVPPHVTVRTGETRTVFKIATAAATTDTDTWISAKDPNGVINQAFLLISSTWELTYLNLGAASLASGKSTTITASLNLPAPAGGVVVNLSVINDSATPSPAILPATLTVPAGSTTGTTRITAKPVSASASVLLEAQLNGTFLTGSVLITPPLPRVTYTILDPAGWAGSQADGVSQTSQAGSASTPAFSHAGVWSGSAGSFVDLNPVNWQNSSIGGLAGRKQVGQVWFDTDPLNPLFTDAAVWNGTAGSFVDLAPASSIQSYAAGVSGNVIVGGARVSMGAGTYADHAALWVGSAASFVDLNPTKAALSWAYGVAGSTVVGEVALNGASAHAALWRGNANSFVDLHPAGNTWTMSIASAVSGNSQVGYVGYDTPPAVTMGPPPYPYFISHAALWNGTADSFVDLNPVGADFSQANAVSGNIVVGSAYMGDWSFWTQAINEHAALWLGTADSFVDLEAAVGVNWANSEAYGVYADATGIYIVGRCDAGAVLWHIAPGVLP